MRFLPLLIALLIISRFAFSIDQVRSYKFFDPFGDNELSKTQVPDKPMVPFQQIFILLPADVSDVKVEAVRGEVRWLEEVSSLEVAPSMPFTKSFSIPFEQVEIDGVWPSVIDNVKIQKFHGYNIVMANIYPIFLNANRKVFKGGAIDVKISYETLKGGMAKVRMNNEVFNLVDNPDWKLFETYRIEKHKDNQDYDYLIVSTAELISYEGPSSLNEFISYLQTAKGLKVRLADIAEIKKQNDGIDDAEKLRNFIKKMYDEFGIKYVLLVGDADGNKPMIPTRKLFAQIRAYYSGSWKDLKDDIPADFYFGCLDGTFNHNGNNRWGEPDDGENGGDVDFLCEVTVGRWPVDDVEQLQAVIFKTLQTYQHDDREKKVLNLGELLFQELNLFGGDYLDQLFGVVDDHGFISRGYDQNWLRYQLYDKQQRWSGTDAKKMIAQLNPLVVNHLGHSSLTTNMRLNSMFGSISFDNILPYFYYTQGCLAAKFTHNDSIVERMLYGKGGPFAVVANSTYGLAPEDPDYGQVRYPGTSHVLHRYFTDNLLNSSGMHFGKAHQKSKEDLLRYIDFQEARWVIWSANFFGDPALTLK